jgi:hypothetical protein
MRGGGSLSAATRAPIDFGWVHGEQRRAGLTLELLWTEYGKPSLSGSLVRAEASHAVATSRA